MSLESDSRPLTTGEARPRLISLLLIVAAAYALSLFAAFLADDFSNLKNALDAGWSWPRLCKSFVISAQSFQDGWMPAALMSKPIRYLRPLFLLSLLADHAIWGFRPVGYHATNILVHLAVVALLYAILRELVEDGPAAWLGALIYGVMPFHTIAVAWVSGRTELLAALGIAASLWGWLKFAKTRRPAWYALSLGALAFGLLAKENAAIVPLLLASYSAIFPRRRPPWALLAPHFSAAALYLFWRWQVLGGFPLPPSSFYYHSFSEPGFARWAAAKGGCLFYGLLFHLPLAYPTEVSLQKALPATAVLLGIAAAIAVGLFRFVRGAREEGLRRLGAFAAAWTILALLPTVPLLVSGLYLYFPLGGICLLYIVLWRRLSETGKPRWLQKPRWRKILLAAVLATFILRIQAGNLVAVAASRAASDLLAEIKAGIGKQPPDGLKIYLIDSPLIIGPTKPALQLLWPGRRLELHVLSVSPYLLPRREPISTLEQVDERTLELTAKKRPYLSGAFGLIAFGDRGGGEIEEGRSLEAHGYKIEIAQTEPCPRGERSCVRRFVFRFDEPLSSPDKVFFRYTNGRLARIDFH